jgi:hypothetical protein
MLQWAMINVSSLPLIRLEDVAAASIALQAAEDSKRTHIETMT